MAVPLREVTPSEWLRRVPGGVAAPKGFKAGGLHCGVKRKRNDLALICSDVPGEAAATYTTNRVKSGSLLVAMEHLSLGGKASAVVVTSGNANACNGPQGIKDARAMAAVTAEALDLLPLHVVVAATGVIGVPLDMAKIVPGIRRLAGLVAKDGSRDAAEAIMTTDTFPKEISVEFDLGGRGVRIGGIAKGSGMICPNMATMLSFITTDAAIDRQLLSQALKESVAKTYNMVSVDGDTSTNDMVIVVANGLAGNPRIASDGPDFRRFKEALDSVNTILAHSIVRDGEGASKFIEIRVKGALSEADARQIARSIAKSSLVKTAIYGEDANWGRIFCAAGYSGAEFDPDRVDIYIGSEKVAEGGSALPFDEGRAKEILQDDEVYITVDLRQGSCEAAVWTCDLTYDYVKINASYRT